MTNYVSMYVFFLFINYCHVLFKVTPLRYNTFMPGFFTILETLLKRGFWYRQQLLFWFFFYRLNHSKTLYFHQCPQFSEVMLEVITFLSKCKLSLKVVNIFWAMSMRLCFCSKFGNFKTIFAAARFMPKTFVKLLDISRTICQHQQQPL